MAALDEQRCVEQRAREQRVAEGQAAAARERKPATKPPRLSWDARRQAKEAKVVAQARRDGTKRDCPRCGELLDVGDVKPHLMAVHGLNLQEAGEAMRAASRGL